MVYGGCGPRLGSLLASCLPGTSLFDRWRETCAYSGEDLPLVDLPSNLRSMLQQSNSFDLLLLMFVYESVDAGNDLTRIDHPMLFTQNSVNLSSGRTIR